MSFFGWKGFIFNSFFPAALLYKKFKSHILTENDIYNFYFSVRKLNFFSENKHPYPHAPNRAIFYPSQNEALVQSYDIQGKHFLNESNFRTPTEQECQNDPEDRERQSLLPNVIGIGAKKCGTTALYYYMKAHPKVG